MTERTPEQPPPGSTGRRDEATTPDPADVVLIACSASKLSRAALARDLYTGAVFRLSLTYAELRGAHAFIVSARHKLVLLTETIDPYDFTMGQLGKTAREAWAEDVGRRLRNLITVPRSIEILAPKLYAESLAALFRHYASGHRQDVRAGWPVPTTPLAGLGIGQQKSWLIARARELRAKGEHRSPEVVHLADHEKPSGTWCGSGTRSSPGASSVTCPACQLFFCEAGCRTTCTCRFRQR